MAICNLADLPLSQLAGRYCCLPSLLVDRLVGEPALILMASPGRLTCIQVPREWRPVEGSKDGEFYYDTSVKLSEDTHSLKRCKRTSVRFVCDTVEEAIALSNLARQAELALRDATRAVRGQFEVLARQAVTSSFPKVLLQPENEVTHAA